MPMNPIDFFEIIAALPLWLVLTLASLAALGIAYLWNAPTSE